MSALTRADEAGWVCVDNRDHIDTIRFNEEALLFGEEAWLHCF